MPVLVLRQDAVAEVLADRPEGGRRAAFAKIIDGQTAKMNEAASVNQIVADVAQRAGEVGQGKASRPRIIKSTPSSVKS